MITGIDVSHFNALPSLATYSFVFAKCTQGASFVDPTYSSKQAAVRTANKVFGAYHFMTATDTPDAQATYFAQHAYLAAGDIIAVDFETDGTWSNYSNAALANAGSQVISAIKQALPGHRIVLYCNQNDYATKVVPYSMLSVADGLWIADYSGTPPMTYIFWQDNDAPIDADEAQFSTQADLQGWALMTTPTDPWQELVIDPSTGQPARDSNGNTFTYAVSYGYVQKEFWKDDTVIQGMPAQVTALTTQVTQLTSIVSALSTKIAALTGSLSLAVTGTLTATPEASNG